jgi:magnesium transporter
MPLGRSADRLHQSLADITRLLQKHRVLDTLTHRQEGQRQDLLDDLQHRQNLAELHARCRVLHPADLAYILEALPLDERRLVWAQTPAGLRGQVLVEVADTVREGLVDELDRQDLVAALGGLDADDLAYLEGAVPTDVWQDVSRALDAGELTFLRTSMAYQEHTIGHLMSGDFPAIREAPTLGDLLADLRRRAEPLPEHTDRILVVDARNVLRGAVSTSELLRRDPATATSDVLDTELAVFAPEDPLDDAVKAFERYDLVSAPVVDDRGKLVGRLTVDVVMDYVRQQADRTTLKRAGLSGEEDLFAPVADSARNRWPWLLVNLVTAFLASRVIGVFEQTIGQVVALAALMPIVASVGGNTGNQTIALVVRGLALEQVQSGNTRHLLRKELTVSMLNGLLWGGVMGLAALAIYRSAPLGAVMAAAVLLNLIVAALVGVAVPVLLQRAGRDPAQGASVLLTFITDSMGFFLFLGLARLFLV